MIFVLGIVNCHIKNNMLMAVAMFVVTYVSVICSAYNILAQWQNSSQNKNIYVYL